MTKIRNLKQDNKNFNKGNAKGQAMIKASLEEFGAGRSILVDKDNNIIAGNKTAIAAMEAGFEDVIIVDTTGDELVAVKRTDLELDTQKGRGLALADDATQQASFTWDEDAVLEVEAEFGLDLQDWKVPISRPTEHTGGTSGGATPPQETIETKDLKIKFTPDEYNFVLAKLRETSDVFETALLKTLHLL